MKEMNTMKMNVKNMRKDELQSLIETLLTQNIELSKQLESSDRRVNDNDIVIQEGSKVVLVYLSGKSMKTLVAFAKQLKNAKGEWLLSYNSEKKAWGCLKNKENMATLEGFKNEMLETQPR